MAAHVWCPARGRQIEQVRLVELGLDLARDALGLHRGEAGGVEVFENDDELVAAHARHRVAFTDAAFQATGGVHQQLVADIVALEKGEEAPRGEQAIRQFEADHAADYDQVATTALPDVLGKNYIDHQDFNLLPDTVKTLPPIKLDEKTGYIGVIAYFSDDQATEWKQIEPVESIGHHYRLLVHIRASAIEMKKEEN